MFKAMPANKETQAPKDSKASKVFKDLTVIKVHLVCKEFRERQALVVDKAQPAHRDRQAYKALQVRLAHKDCKDSLACKAQMVQTVDQFDTERFPQIPWLGVMAISTSTR
jgi:hypothetical protein